MADFRAALADQRFGLRSETTWKGRAGGIDGQAAPNSAAIGVTSSGRSALAVTHKTGLSAS
jgi:hypothetical protein